MYNTTDHGDGATEYLHDFHLDTYGGQSGSPIWHVNTTGEYIITILAYEILGGMAPNFGTRINTQKYNQLAAWLAEDISPVKRGDAYVIAAGMSLEPWQEVLKTRTRFVIATDVYNQGTATIESIDVGFYVSKDDEINATDDYFLGSATITDLQIMESDNADWIGTVPKDVPDGYYYVGWIIDPDNEVDELNKEDNNNGFSWRVNVQSTPLQDFMKTTLGMAIVYGSIAVVVAVPVLLVILAIGKSRRRKKLAMGIQ